MHIVQEYNGNYNYNDIYDYNVTAVSSKTIFSTRNFLVLGSQELVFICISAYPSIRTNENESHSHHNDSRRYSTLNGSAAYTISNF